MSILSPCKNEEKFSYEAFISYTDHKFLSELNSAGGLSQTLVNNFEKRKIIKRVVSITKDETEEMGLTKADVDILESSIAGKLEIDKSEIFMNLPPLKVVPTRRWNTRLRK